MRVLEAGRNQAKMPDLLSTLLQSAAAIFRLAGSKGLVTLLAMPLKSPARQRRKGPPPGETGQEALYLRFLSEKQVPVTVKLRDGEAVYGWIEYFDDRMIRLTREGKPNLFIYKNQIRTISESYRNIEARRRERSRTSARPATALPAPDAAAPYPNPVLALVPATPADTHFIDALSAASSCDEPGN